MSLYLSVNQRLTLFSNISTMLHAGIPILEVVESLQEDAQGPVKKVLKQIYLDLNQGKTLSQSLTHFPDTFDAVSIHLVSASEESGTLETALKDLVEATRKEQELREKIQGALTYPALVVVVFIGVMLLVLSFVIPRISTVFQNLGVELPLPTKILVMLSNAWLKYTWVIFGSSGVLIALASLLYARKRRQFLRLMSKLPGFASLAKLSDLANISRSLSLLLKSGIPITQALELSQNVVQRGDMALAIKDIQEKVSTGKNLSEVLKQHKKLFPNLLITVAKAGEKSGTLAESLAEANVYFEQLISRRVKQISILLEPIMLVVVGVLVGGMMLAILAPIYGLIGSITPQ